MLVFDPGNAGKSVERVGWVDLDWMTLFGRTGLLVLLETYTSLVLQT
jgi:hypothetical protein